MKQYIKIIILCIGMVYGVNKIGTTAAKFLSIEVGSNAVGMGGAYTSIANDATAMYWNPAGLSFHDTKEVYFNHANWIADISFDYFGITFPMNNKSVLGFNLTSVTMDENGSDPVRERKYRGNISCCRLCNWIYVCTEFNRSLFCWV